MKNIKVITDSSCDISYKLDNVVIVPREFYFLGDDIIYKDDYTRSDKDYYSRLDFNCKVKMVDIVSYNIIRAMEEEYKNGIRHFILVSQSKKIKPLDYNEYERAARYFLEDHKECFATIIDTDLYSIGLGLFVTDINYMIEANFDYRSIIALAKTNEQYYTVCFYDTNELAKPSFRDSFKLKNKDLYKPLYTYDRDKGFKVESVKKTKNSLEYDIANAISDNFAMESSILVGSILSDSEKLEDTLFHRFVLDEIFPTKIGKINGHNLGKKTLGIAYKKTR